MSAVLEESIDIKPERVELLVEVTPEIRRAVHSTGALAIAQAWDIDGPEMAQALADKRKAWAKRIDQLEEMKADLFEPAKQALKQMRERLSRWFDAPLAELNAARDLAGQKLLAWQQAEEARVARERAAAEESARKIRQEAEARAAAERARAEQQAAEKRRQEQEALAAQRKAEAEGNQRAAAAAAAAAAKAAEQAQAAIENGYARAQEAQLQAAAAASAMPAPTVTAISGQSVKDQWLAVLQPGVTADEAKIRIIEAIVKEGRTDLLALIAIDTAARGPLNRLAAALKNAMNVPGYRAENHPTLAGARK